MNPIELISIYYPKESALKNCLLEHSEAVAQKSLSIAAAHPELKLDTQFLYEAAMLHDIGIFLTDAPGIHCVGAHPYICHGYLGAELVRRAGFPQHAWVCERHTGAGISLRQIMAQNYPVPHRDMIPTTREEQVICFADKFFSKSHLGREKRLEEARASLEKHGIEGVQRFDGWAALFL